MLQFPRNLIIKVLAAETKHITVYFKPRSYDEASFPPHPNTQQVAGDANELANILE